MILHKKIRIDFDLWRKLCLLHWFYLALSEKTNILTFHLLIFLKHLGNESLNDNSKMPLLFFQSPSIFGIFIVLGLLSDSISFLPSNILLTRIYASIHMSYVQNTTVMQCLEQATVQSSSWCYGRHIPTETRAGYKWSSRNCAFMSFRADAEAKRRDMKLYVLERYW